MTHPSDGDANNSAKPQSDAAAEPDTARPPTPLLKQDPLPAAALRWRCHPEELPFATTDEVEPLAGVIGQDGAVEALRFGLEIRAPGQNIFVRGLKGTGRMTIISRLLQELRLNCPILRDRCYVHNFAQHDRPRLITLDKGQGPLFKRRMGRLANFIRDDLSSLLSAEGMAARKKALEEDANTAMKRVVEPFEESLKEAGLALVTIQAGPAVQTVLFPLIDGKPVPPEEWEKLRQAGKVTAAHEKRFAENHARHQEELKNITRQVNEIRHRYLEAVEGLNERAARSILQNYADEITLAFPDEAVGVFLGELIDDAVTSGLLQEGSRSQTEHPQQRREPRDPTDRYHVNVIHSHGQQEGCPIVTVTTPTMQNLLGGVDRSFAPDGRPLADHTTVRGGALLQADGGYLILDVRDLLREPGAWKVLIRTLRTGRLEIVPDELSMPWWGPAIKPEPIDVDIKVILVGDSETYYALDQFDPDFEDLFKVLADFDAFVRRDARRIEQYSGVLARIIKEEKLPAFDRTAVAALAEHGARIAASRDKLTTRFGRLADIAREAAFLAGKQCATPVTGEHVMRAIREAKQRADLPARRFRELLADGTLQVQTRGEVVGQVNGLAVLQAGPLTYGIPARITATLAPGHAGVINIEREAALSGAIHTKSIYILNGLLRYLLRTVHPLAFHASLAFEQSYGQIDGDSASCAQVCCLLSSLTDIPIRQDLAMTGAIDQVGHVMAIGGVNEKIEGFFDTCADAGFSGSQGVIIPKSNAGDLMLRQDVVDACEGGQFCVFAVETVHEALELLTGTPAGQRDEEGMYPDDSLLGLAVARAFEFWVRASQTFDAYTMEEEGEEETEESDAGDTD